MDSAKQAEAFYTDVLALVSRYRSEFDLRPWEIVGLLHALTFEVAQFPDLEDADLEDFSPDE
jgi:hypothetical protein